jgi:hypothetical protein
VEGRDEAEIPAHGRAAHIRAGNSRIVVTNRLTGSFPGSPIEIRFVFTLAGDKIASLEIG